MIVGPDVASVRRPRRIAYQYRLSCFRSDGRRVGAVSGIFEERRGHASRVLDRHSDMVAGCAHEWSPPGLVEAIEETWSEALRTGSASKAFAMRRYPPSCGDAERRDRSCWIAAHPD